MLLVLFTTVLPLAPHHMSVVVLVLTVVWILLSDRARREYIVTVRGYGFRLEPR